MSESPFRVREVHNVPGRMYRGESPVVRYGVEAGRGNYARVVAVFDTRVEAEADVEARDARRSVACNRPEYQCNGRHVGVACDCNPA